MFGSLGSSRKLCLGDAERAGHVIEALQAEAMLAACPCEVFLTRERDTMQINLAPTPIYSHSVSASITLSALA